MPRYYFHVHDGVEHPDHDGIELRDLEEARQQGVRYAGELLCHAGKTFWQSRDWSLEVRSQSGLSLFALHVFAVDSPATQ